MKKTLPLSSLVEDMELYPRHAVDDSNVRSLALAIEAGCELPPIVADEKSKRIVDGWHRARAWKRVHGPSAVVDVDLRKYKSEAELVEDAIQLNSAHGRRMDVIDQTRSALMLERYGVPMSRIAVVMHVTEERAKKLVVRVATAKTPNKGTVPGTQTVTLKRSVAHMAGRSLNAAQSKAHDSMPGSSFLLIAKQLTTAIETKLVNLDDEKLVSALRALRNALKGI